MNRKARNYWTYWQHLTAALEPFITEKGYLPTQKDLRERGLSSLARVFRYYGGYEQVARRLGVPTAEEYHRSRLSDWDAFSQELAPYIASRGYFPTGSELTREGRYDLISALRRYHGGAAMVSKRLGIPSYTTFHGRRSAGHWTEARILAGYRDAIRTHGFTQWPSPGDLRRLGFGPLQRAIQILGMKKLREILAAEGITLSAKPRKLGHLIPFVQKYAMRDEIYERGELFFYYLGLVASDGSFVATRNEQSVELCLKHSDREILEKLRDRISPTRPIHIKPSRKNSAHAAVRLKFTDRRLVATLQEYIQSHDKSHTLTWPEIPDEHLKHFIRGYIDGDGTIGIALTRQNVQGEMKYYPVIRLRVLGTEAFLTGLTQTIQRIFAFKLVKVQPKGKERVCELQYSGRHAIAILDMLYADATIWLHRKRAVYDYLREADRETLLTNYGTEAGRYNYLASKGGLFANEDSA